MPEPSEVLEGIYEEFSPHPFPGKAHLAQSDTANSTPSSVSGSNSDTSPSPEWRRVLLLTRNAVPALLGKFEPTGARLSADLYTAIRRRKGGQRVNSHHSYKNITSKVYYVQRTTQWQ